MNKHIIVMAVAMFVCLMIAVVFHVNYFYASIAFGLVALVFAPIAIHKIVAPGMAAQGIAMLAFFAAYPIRKFLDINGLIEYVALTLGIAALLWIVGMGWKRSWKIGAKR